MRESHLSHDAASTRSVLDHHLGAFAQGIDAILQDYTVDSVLITRDAEFRGLASLRGFFQAFLDSATPEFWAAFEIHRQVVEGSVAFLIWSAPPSIALATDTLLVRDGRIAVQTFSSFPA